MEAFDIPALHALCIELSIPGPAAEACLAQAASARRHPCCAISPLCSDASRAEAAMRELQAKCAPLCPNGLLELAVLLSAALEAREHYAARGVPDDVYLATMGCFSRFLNETHRWTGRWQFDRGFWVWRQLCGRLLRLGTLEFEALPLPAELAGPLGAAAGAPALSVHIPGDAMCTPEALHASYARRAALFCPRRRFAVDLLPHMASFAPREGAAPARFRHSQFYGGLHAGRLGSRRQFRPSLAVRRTGYPGRRAA